MQKIFFWVTQKKIIIVKDLDKVTLTNQEKKLINVTTKQKQKIILQSAREKTVHSVWCLWTSLEHFTACYIIKARRLH